MAQKVGIYTGTFDPIHKGHISFALEAAKTCGLDTVAFIPEAHPRGKTNVTHVTSRIEQIGAAIANYPSLEVATLDAERFTYESTINELRKLYPQAHFTLLMGSDVAMALPQWDDIGKLLQNFPEIAIGLRNDDTEEKQLQIIQPLQDRYNFAVCFCRTEHAEKSSSSIRRR